MARSTFSPDPAMGLPPRWNVGDLPQSYSTPVEVLHAVSANTVSAAFNPQGNAAEIWCTFSKADTKCSIVVTADDGTGTFVPLATFNNVSMLADSNLQVGEFWQGRSLAGRPIKVAVANYSGTGTITVRVSRN